MLAFLSGVVSTAFAVAIAAIVLVFRDTRPPSITQIARGKQPRADIARAIARNRAVAKPNRRRTATSSPTTSGDAS